MVTLFVSALLLYKQIALPIITDQAEKLGMICFWWIAVVCA